MFQTEWQWCPLQFRPPRHEGPGDPTERIQLQGELESIFEAWLPGVHVLILPSCRSALAMALRHLELKRGDAIAAPRWSSSCLWSLLGRFACPTLTFDQEAQAFLAVHKYGYPERVPAVDRPIIEDSCDSLLVTPQALFPNHGVMEIVSLPKILGTYGGGLLLMKDGATAERLRPLTRAMDSFQATQGWLRWEDAAAPEGAEPRWDHLSYRHTTPDLPLLTSIAEAMKTWQARAACIEDRLDWLKHHAPELMDSSPFRPAPGRLPAVLPIPEGLLEPGPLPLPIRRMNISGRADAPSFSPMRLLPLHIGNPEPLFQEQVTSLAAALRPVPSPK